MNNIAVIDVIFAALIFILAIRCSLRGFVEEALSMAAVVLGLLTAVLLYKNGAAFIRTKYLAETQVLPEIMAFVILFLLVYAVIKILQSILKDIIERISLGGVDRFLGLIFGLIEGFVLVALALVLLTIQPLFNAGAVLGESFFAKLLLPLVSIPGTLGIPFPLAGAYV